MCVRARAFNILKNKNQILGSSLRTSIHNSQRISSIKNIDTIQLDKVLNVLLENDTWQIPTISMYKGLAYEEYNDDKWKNSFEYLPQKIKEKCHEIKGFLEFRCESRQNLTQFCVQV